MVRGFINDILQTHVLPIMQQISRLNFQQDNAISHMARLSQDFLHAVTTLSWPVRSPDLSPFQHMFARIANNLHSKRTGPLTSEKLKDAEQCLVRRVQAREFSEDFKKLERKEIVSSNSNLKSLNSFIDDKGTIRVGVILGNSELGYGTKYPIALPEYVQGVERNTVQEIQQVLHNHNILVHKFKVAKDRVTSDNYKVVIHPDRVSRGEYERRFNAPTTNEIAAVVVISERTAFRDIVIQAHDGRLT
ncbi:helitron_like_N domain-containing protein [Trichonephila clavipes]|nr:helitron_like_N domain-containing protein [Trichonephila clavipes]